MVMIAPRSGRWPSSDSTGLTAQIDQVAANALVELAAAGMARDDVVRSVIYVVSDEGAALASLWNRLTSLAPAFTTASALLGISQLGSPHQRVELDLTARRADGSTSSRPSTTGKAPDQRVLDRSDAAIAAPDTSCTFGAWRLARSGDGGSWRWICGIEM